MDIENYYRSISHELEALRHRVRYMISGSHWPTDGEWKESVLRQILRRTASQNITVGRGFVVDRNRSSSQIDVLIYDNTMPLLYKDGDLVFVTPWACRAIVEVKSAARLQIVASAAGKLARDAAFIRAATHGRPFFAGLFAFVFDADAHQGILVRLCEASGGDENGIIDHVALGSSIFVKYWQADPKSGGAAEAYKSWHLYRLKELAPGVFHSQFISEGGWQSALATRKRLVSANGQGAQPRSDFWVFF